MFLHFGVIFWFQAFGWKGCFSPNLLFGYETTNHQIIHTFNQCTYWCCRNLVLTVITKLQNSWKSWKFPLKLPFFANLQVLNWFFIITGISEDIQVSPCGSAWGMSNVTEGKQSALRRVLELLSLMPVHYIYDSNQQVWRQVEEGVGDWVIFGESRQGHKTFLYPRTLMRHHV